MKRMSANRQARAEAFEEVRQGGHEYVRIFFFFLGGGVQEVDERSPKYGRPLRGCVDADRSERKPHVRALADFTRNFVEFHDRITNDT